MATPDLSQFVRIQKIDKNFFTGSADTFRKIIGGTMVFDSPDSSISGEEGLEGVVLREDTHTMLSADDFNGVATWEFPDSDSVIQYIQTNVDLIRSARSSATIASATPFYRVQYPVRIIGNDSLINNEQEWLTAIMGGRSGPEEYEKIYSEGTFDVLGFSYHNYYSQLEKNKLNLAAERSGATLPDLKFFDIGYRYNSYLRPYQNYIQNLNEKQLPSIYFFEINKLSYDTDAVSFLPMVHPEIEAFTTREKSVDLTSTSRDVHAAKDVQLTRTPPPYILTIKIGASDRTEDGEYKDRSLNMRKYMTESFMFNDLSDETINTINEKTKNLYYTAGSLKKVINPFQDESADDYIPIRYPMYAKISFPSMNPRNRSVLDTSKDSYSKVISDNNLQEEVLSYLRGSFVGGTMGGSIETIEYLSNSKFYKTNNKINSISEVTQSFEQNTNCVDFYNMFVDIIEKNETQEQTDELIITSDYDETYYAVNKESGYRYDRVLNGTKALEQCLKITNGIVGHTIGGDYLRDMGTDGGKKNFVALTNKIFEDSLKENSEVIAFRIEKIAGAPFGESVTEREKVQDIYLFNDPNNNPAADAATFSYYDTQVKYGEEYTYAVYAYMVVSGYKYRYRNLRYGKMFAQTVDIDDEGVIDALTAASDVNPEVYCIKFTDPKSGTPVEQLLNRETNIRTSLEGSILFDMYHVADGQYSLQAMAFFDWVEETTSFDPHIDSGGSTADPVNAAAMLTTMFGPTYGTITHPFYESDAAVTLFKDWCRLNREWTMLRSRTFPREGRTLAIGTVITLVDESSGELLYPNTSIKSANKYLADFHFEIEPTVKIVEVPLSTHTFRILDHPPVACDVSPYQRKDNSNIIGFYINQESPSLNSNSQKIFQDSQSTYGLYPTPISPAEEDYKEDYLSSNSMLPEQIIYDYSISPITTVNVYRIDYKPETLKDFDNNLVFKKRLGVDYDNDYNYTNCFYEEAVKTNKKYYYLFKFINANGTTGYVSPIQVAELVDDGGYKYAVFDTMFETDLVAYNPKQISTDFKKLLHILPNPRHTEIQRDNINRSDDAHTLVATDSIKVGTASEPIWGKKFKFRLTSKKTGKKIDLNVKYNLGN